MTIGHSFVICKVNFVHYRMVENTPYIAGLLLASELGECKSYHPHTSFPETIPQAIHHPLQMLVKQSMVSFVELVVTRRIKIHNTLAVSFDKSGSVQKSALCDGSTRQYFDRAVVT